MDNSETVLRTERLVLRQLTVDDAEFILELLNEPSFLRYIGDKGVRSVEDARRYILDGPVDSYERHGFGLYLVELAETAEPIGICGLLKREALDDVDVGFALRPRHWSKGYAIEAAAAVMDYGRDTLGLKRIVAITTHDNESSVKVLEKLGLHFEKRVTLGGEEEVDLFG